MNFQPNPRILLAIALITNKIDSSIIRMWYDSIRICLWLEIDLNRKEDREFEQSLLLLNDLHYNTLTHDLSCWSTYSKEYINFHQAFYHSTQKHKLTKEYQEFVYLLSLI